MTVWNHHFNKTFGRFLRPSASRAFCVACLSALIALSAIRAGTARGSEPYDQEPINYRTAAVNDPVARLQQRMSKGELALPYDSRHGYLPAVLKELRIPVSSQALVFSKTSFQRDL